MRIYIKAFLSAIWSGVRHFFEDFFEEPFKPGSTTGILGIVIYYIWIYPMLTIEHAGVPFDKFTPLFFIPIIVFMSGFLLGFLEMGLYLILKDAWNYVSNEFEQQLERHRKIDTGVTMPLASDEDEISIPRVRRKKIARKVHRIIKKQKQNEPESNRRLTLVD